MLGAEYINHGRETMKTNIGGIDRVFRIVAGLVLLSLVFMVDGNARWYGLIGLAPLITGLWRWCPLYAVLGLNTCPLSMAR